eukprot:268253_1
MIEFSKTLHKMGNKKSYCIQQMKQILLSAISIIDNNNIKKARKKPVKKSEQKENAPNNADNNSNQECIHYDINCTNTAFVRKMGKNASTELLTQCEANKNEFNNGTQKILYNEETCQNRKRESFPLAVYESMDTFLESASRADPNTMKHRLRRNPKTTEKEEHQYHYTHLQGTIL